MGYMLWNGSWLYAVERLSYTLAWPYGTISGPKNAQVACKWDLGQLGTVIHAIRPTTQNSHSTHLDLG